MKALNTTELERNAQIAYNLKRLRAERGMSQADLAKSVGISQSLLAMMETGARVMTVPMSISLANSLGCNVSEIIGE